MAIPAFAHRYDVACHFCHDGYPEAQPHGPALQGARLPHGQRGAVRPGAWVRTVPLTVRATGTRFLVEDGERLQLRVHQGDHRGQPGPARCPTGWTTASSRSEGDDNFDHSEPDNAWLRRGGGDRRQALPKGGRFELDLPFTQTRTPHLFSYEIYFANTGLETDTIADYQDGVEVGGDLPGDVRWSAAVVGGRTRTGADEHRRGRGRVRRQRLPAPGQARERRTASARSPTSGATRWPPSPDLVWQDNILRVGADANVWVQRLNVYGVAMYGRNDNSVATPARAGRHRQVASFTRRLPAGRLPRPGRPWCSPCAATW